MKPISNDAREPGSLHHMVSRQDVDTLYDLLYVCERLYWNSDVGNKQAQARMDELHAGKHGDQQGFFVQTLNAIDKVRTTLPANTVLAETKSVLRDNEKPI